MPLATQETMIERLRRQTLFARSLGFRVRGEWLDGQQATWCEVGGMKVLFVDLSLSVAEQLEQVESSLADYQLSIGLSTSRRLAA